MNGLGRRTAAACPRLAARDSLYTPARVVELDLEVPGVLRSPGGAPADAPDGRVLALVRLHGHPLGLVSAHGALGDTAGLYRTLADAAHRQLNTSAAERDARPHPGRTVRAAEPGDPPAVSVIVATHNRPEPLRRCLNSLLRSGHPSFEIIVVDSAPSDDAAEKLVRERYTARVRYVRESLAGLARAHNRGLAVAHGRICAFTDDDALVDPGWIAALDRAFADRAADPDTDGERVDCVTGLILPADLKTAAQCAHEGHGGFSKGFTRRSWSVARPPTDPLFPFTAGQYGSGANMAFRTDVLRELGGFAPAVWTGTPSQGGDELLAFFRVLAAGSVIVYQPDAIVWHRHRPTPAAAPAPAFHRGGGLDAFPTAALRRLPTALRGPLRRAFGHLRSLYGYRRRAARA
ncbi:glycosyltransferase family 2 protein [Streptomyces piniterrae]|uniref:Glycosyltransferase family 2 protein n=1 Tax=Streptomyces piniterrae TaxID=2571125 RepID=A0A4V5MLY3_9ACTN|nr:glycosyltransferase family A protein [Streptomyces piniterrae]TJZ58928.1 glycosyltransferase family 2 protein [Streptomyces piniterrae]